MSKRSPYQPSDESFNQYQVSETSSKKEESLLVHDSKMPNERDRNRFIIWVFGSQVLFGFICLAGLLAMAMHIHLSYAGHSGTATLPMPTHAEHINQQMKQLELSGPGNSSSTDNTKYSWKYLQYILSDPTKNMFNGSHTIVTMKYPDQKTNISKNKEFSVKATSGKWKLSKKKSGTLESKNISITVVRKGSARSYKISNVIIKKAMFYPDKTDISLQKDLRKVHPNKTGTITSANIQSFTILLNAQSVSRRDIVNEPIQLNRKQTKGFVFGVSMNMNVPVSQQEMSTVGMNGDENKLWDFLPSIYTQYHFTNKIYIQTELQFFSPQLTTQSMLNKQLSEVTTNFFKANEIKLHKLYYLNVPVSVYYSPFSNLYIGTGLQYSYLKRSIFIQEVSTWKKNSSAWQMTTNTKSVYSKSNSEKEMKRNLGNGNGGRIRNGNSSSTQASSPIDTVARNIKTNDWRWMFDATYQYHRFHTGVHFSMAFDQYIRSRVGNVSADIKDKNKSLQFFIRYTILDKRRRTP